MQFFTDSNMQFPLVELSLNQGETVFIQRGSMELQSVGKALFGGQGGFFVMTTQGQGTLLANAYGSIKKIELNNQEVTIDNAHVVAWSQTLDYNIHLENGFWQSIGTGEGVVNTFRGTGEIYVQSLNLQTFAGLLNRYLPKRS